MAKATAIFDMWYYSLNDFLREKFGKKLYKLALNGGMTCPNRDGTKGTGGCVFCTGSGEFAADAQKSVAEQLRQAKDKLRLKLPKAELYGFIAYFQAFTNTYAPVDKLRNLFTEAMDDPEVEVLSIATRPDCLKDDVLALLQELNKKKPVWVELGLQTANEETAKKINRCFDNTCFIQAVQALRARGIEVIVHLILGLPGETEKDLLSTLRFIGDHDIQGVKLHLLHVLRGTTLAEMGYTPLEREEYFHLVALCLEHIPAGMVIHRLTGDGDKKLLLAPLWSGDKHRVLNDLHGYLVEHNVRQGSAVH